jgi:DNA gyrase subunit B
VSKQGETHTYDARNIKVLPGIEGVRKRPAMYIGDTNVRGLHHLIEEVVANSIDEAVGGHCDTITVRLNLDGSVAITDNGRGIPVDMHKQEKKPAVEVIMTTLHSGGKFDHTSYKVSAGLHGVGLSCVNALSEWLEVEIKLGGKVHHQEYARGVTQSKLKVLGKAKGTGTKITFKPDADIFEVVEFNYETIVTRLRELAFLNSGITIKLSREDGEGEEDVFHYKGGLAEFVSHLNETKSPLHRKVIHFKMEDGDVSVELAMQFTDSYAEVTPSFANNIHTHDGGTHLSGLKSALTRTFNNYARAQNLLKNGKAPSGDDIREGLTVVLSVMLPDPQFEAQSKNKLNNPTIEGVVESCVNERLGSFLEENPKIAKTICNKAVQAFQAREAARKARDLTRRKGALSSGNLPLNLSDCSSKNVEATELFIVEGQSAGGNAKQCRDSTFQAILPLQGKILNVEKARIDRMLNFEGISMLISAIGTGIGHDDFDPSKSRYGKIIIMTDADVDGLHIRTLLLTFFFRHMRELIDLGHVYIAQPPLYGVKRKSKITYYLNDQDFGRAMLEQGTDGTTLERRDGKAGLSGAKLRELVEELMSMEGQARVLNRHGVELQQIIETWIERKKLPIARITINSQTHLAYSQKEVDALLKQAEAVQGRPLQVKDSEDDEGDEGDEMSVDIVELHEVANLKRSIEKIQKCHFSLEDYYPPEEIDEEEEPALTIKSNGDTIGIWSLSELPGAVRRVAEKGMEIQRYKGLGEMNADQLGETSMDPNSRGLLRVTIDDAVEADRLFTLLMGDKVGPRREFIERHALEATDLDF